MIVVILFIVMLAPEPAAQELYIPSLQHPEQFGRNTMLDFWSGRP